MNHTTHHTFHLLPVTAAVLVMCAAASAQTASEPETKDIKALVSPDASGITLGAGFINNARDALRFGQYTGYNNDASPIIDFEMIRRDEASGALTTLTGRDLGLDTRELLYSRERQGDWKYALDYNEIVRNDPSVINTGMTGIGTVKPTVNLIQLPAMSAAWATANGVSGSAVAGTDVQLKLQRTAVGLSGSKWISPNLQLELAFRNETKTGARLFGRAGLDSSDIGWHPAQGTGSLNGNWAVLLAPEPVNSSIQQIDTKLNFHRGNLAMTGGYTGSFYTNSNGNLTLNVPPTLNRGALWNVCADIKPATTPPTKQPCVLVKDLASSDVALPPDNQAHQVYVDGTYGFSPTTRANFKLSYTQATQNESFVGMGLTPAATAPASLDGVVNTKLAQVGLTMRPLKDLSVNGSLRIEDRSDNTPVYVYNTINAPNPNDPRVLTGTATNALNKTTNWPSGSQKRTTAKVDAAYRLGNGYTTTAGLDWERKTAPLPPANTALFAKQVFFREVLTETGVHAGLRKAFAETLNGAFSLGYKQRRGDDNGWFTTSDSSTTPPHNNELVAFDPGSAAVVAGATVANRVLPDMYMDRNQTKVRGNLDWEPSEKFSLQTVLEHKQDDYLRAWPASVLATGVAQVVPTIAGARTISNDSLTLDASYKLASNWQLGAYLTHSQNRWNVNKANLGDDTVNKSDTLGVNIGGKLGARFSIGAGLVWSNDVTTFNNVVATAVAGQAAGNIAGFGAQPGNFLPDINYRTAKFNLSGRYELDKKSSVLMSLVHQKFENDDWQWGYNGVPFLYSDNTTVSNPNQSLTFVGVSYNYKF